jgi:hypothetical protein
LGGPISIDSSASFGAIIIFPSIYKLNLGSSCMSDAWQQAIVAVKPGDPKQTNRLLTEMIQ